ncbi:hypothetical protein KCP69_19045 [Salmonella enterica subsp. enterica]|nr:hypothetical protein KCP69_19045 [Salmonella enterica subsp. enterica]
MEGVPVSLVVAPLSPDEPDRPRVPTARGQLLTTKRTSFTTRGAPHFALAFDTGCTVVIRC